MRTLPRHLPWLAALLALVVVAALIAFGVAWLTAPSIAGLQARVGTTDRALGARPVRLHTVAPVMREAIVATEDERFYRHDGIDVVGILRAIPYDVSHLSLAEGASTITEQLAKLVYLGGYATAAEARRALGAPLRVASGRRLPALRGVSIVSGPPFYWAELGAGLGLLALGIAGVVGLRRAGRRLARLAWAGSRLAAGLAVVAGAFLVLGSFRGV
jgi:hypothetical protein